MPLNTIKRFLQLESTAGLLLVAAAAIALIVSNTPLFSLYQYVLSVPLVVTLGELGVDKPLLLWINDGLMAVFFMLIGLEVKREVFEGELRTVSQIALPAAAAIGGFLVPALIYVWFNWDSKSALEGWAIPAATDIAFALGVLTLLGSRVPIGLKVFLTTIAIFDDLAAIVVIAVFYADNLSIRALAFATVGLVLLFIMNRRGVMRIAPYIIIGMFVWLSVLKSGVHATLAGILVSFSIPMKRDVDGASPAQQLEHTLHPWVTYMILPVFAFANAGVSFKGIPAEALTGGVAVGIAVSLFIGKQFGVFITTWLIVKLGIARLPEGANWLAVYGIALLTGIGFTMSLFIGTLAFEAGAFNYIAATRVGVLAGSILSAAAGYAILRLAFRDAPEQADI
jgi:NhaA family Na+:H+ antiporter